MANQHRGEADIVLGGKNRTIRIDFEVIAQVEDHLGRPFNTSIAEGYFSGISSSIYFGLKGNKGRSRLSIKEVQGMMDGSKLADYTKAVSDAYIRFMGVDPDADTDDDNASDDAGEEPTPFPRSTGGAVA